MNTPLIYNQTKVAIKAANECETNIKAAHLFTHEQK